MCSSNASGKAAAQARKADTERAGDINRGMKSINKEFSGENGFNDKFYNDRGQSYSQFYNPQVDRQFDQANQDLAFQQARQGIDQSSAGAHEFGLLRNAYGTQKQAIQGQAQDYANQTRMQVEQQKSNLIDQLHSTSDPAAAASAAVNRAHFLAQQGNNFSPLGNLFSNVAGLSQQYQQNQAYSPAQQSGLLAQQAQSTGSSSGGSAKGSSRIVNG